MTPPCPIKPTLGRIVVRPVQEKEMTEGGLFMPYGRSDSASVMRVLAVCDPYHSASDDQDASPAGPQFSPSDIILIGKYVGVEVTIGREKYIVLRESDVLGTFNPEEMKDATNTNTDPSLPASGDSGPDSGHLDPFQYGAGE